MTEGELKRFNRANEIKTPLEHYEQILTSFEDNYGYIEKESLSYAIYRSKDSKDVIYKNSDIQEFKAVVNWILSNKLKGE